MGEYADMHLDGTLCECCGVTMRGPGNGEPRRCRDCGPIDAPFVHPSTKVACPTCKKRVKFCGLTDHIRAAHLPAPKPAAKVEPNNDEVICPNCVHQFHAVPVNVQAELSRLRLALRFYAQGDHYVVDDDEFDTVSGEPDNWLCSGRDDSITMIENGGYARLALRGVDAVWVNEDGDDETPQPINGEVSCLSPANDKPACASPDAGSETQAGGAA